MPQDNSLNNIWFYNPANPASTSYVSLEDDCAAMAKIKELAPPRFRVHKIEGVVMWLSFDGVIYAPPFLIDDIRRAAKIAPLNTLTGMPLSGMRIELRSLADLQIMYRDALCRVYG